MITTFCAIGLLDGQGISALVHTPSSKIEDLFHDNTLIKAKSMEYDTDLDVHEFTRILCNIEEKE